MIVRRWTKATHSALSFFMEVQEKMGIMNSGVTCALWNDDPQIDDELPLKIGDSMTVIHRKANEIEPWWAYLDEEEVRVPCSFLGLYPRSQPR